MNGQPDDDDVVVADIAHAQVTRTPIEHRQETARAWLALTLVGLLALMVLSTFAAVLFVGVEWVTIADPVTYLLGLVVGLVGTVVGFYFGQQSR